MKYRRLNTDELQELEAEFIRFLALLSIPGSDWERMKETDPERVTTLIEDFSDAVFERILQNVNYLEHRSAHALRTFSFTQDKAYMLALLVEGDRAIDFTKNQTPEEMLALIQGTHARVSLQQAEKTYKETRALEIFHLMQSGALISKDGALYKLLEQPKAGN